LTLELEHISNFFSFSTFSFFFSLFRSPGNSAIQPRACFAKPLSAHVPLSQLVTSRMDLLKTMWRNACAAKKNAMLEVDSYATQRLVLDLAATQTPVDTVSI